MNELKILLIGDSSVGKTSILLKYTDDKFSDNHISTIGVEYINKSLTINGKKVMLRIWDTSGQERFLSITQNFYRNANGVIFVFDITNRESFKNIKIWLNELENCEGKITRILVGNKVDLEENRDVGKEMINNYIQKKEMKYFEVSAKEGINIDLIFKEMAELILLEQPEIIEDKIKYSHSFLLSTENKKWKKKKQCC